MIIMIHLERNNSRVNCVLPVIAKLKSFWNASRNPTKAWLTESRLVSPLDSIIVYWLHLRPLLHCSKMCGSRKLHFIDLENVFDNMKGKCICESLRRLTFRRDYSYRWKSEESLKFNVESVGNALCHRYVFFLLSSCYLDWRTWRDLIEDVIFDTRFPLYYYIHTMSS